MSSSVSRAWKAVLAKGLVGMAACAPLSKDRPMPSSFFFARLVPNRPNFVMTMTPEEQATMGAHAAFLQSQLVAGTLVIAGPVMDPAGPYGMAVFEAESMEAVHRLLEKDPARAIGRYEVAPLGPTMARPARPAGA